MKLPEQFLLDDDFLAVDFSQWRAAAEAELGGRPFERQLVTHTYEGIDILPVYGPEQWSGVGDPTGFPGFSPMTRGASVWGTCRDGWDIRQEHAHPDAAINAAAIREDLQGGVRSILLRLDVAGRLGFDPDAADATGEVGRDGAMLYGADDFAGHLDGLALPSMGLALDAGAAFHPAAASLMAVFARQRIPWSEMRCDFNADPLAVLARDGRLPLPMEALLDLLGDLASWCDAHAPNCHAVRVGTAPYHHAGATAVQDLAFSLATAVHYLRAMTAAGLTVDQACRQMVFSFAIGCNFFLAIAKLRAARQLWASVAERCGAGTEGQRMAMHVRISKRVLTVRDPYVNMLRNTVCCFAAAVAGANMVTTEPYDRALNPPDTLGRRVARNTQIILSEESHLHRVLDPAGGSAFLEALTASLVGEAWKLFQDVESRGGMLEVLRSGWVASQIDSAFAPRKENLARRRDPITGVSEFPDSGERTSHRPITNLGRLKELAIARVRSARRQASAAATEALRELKQLAADEAAPAAGVRLSTATEAARWGATSGQLALALGFGVDVPLVTPLTPHPYAAPFEDLRTAVDRFVEQYGVRPAVFLANLGPPAVHSARATFARNFFAAGGFDVRSNDGFETPEAAAAAFQHSHAGLAVICSSDEIYKTSAASLAQQLKAAGARQVVLAGNPGEGEAAYREHGVDRFIFMKCDALEILSEMLSEEGVLS